MSNLRWFPVSSLWIRESPRGDARTVFRSIYTAQVENTRTALPSFVCKRCDVSRRLIYRSRSERSISRCNDIAIGINNEGVNAHLTIHRVDNAPSQCQVRIIAQVGARLPVELRFEH